MDLPKGRFTMAGGGAWVVGPYAFSCAEVKAVCPAPTGDGANAGRLESPGLGSAFLTRNGTYSYVSCAIRSIYCTKRN